jgi:hypothetical protein
LSSGFAFAGTDVLTTLAVAAALATWDCLRIVKFMPPGCSFICCMAARRVTTRWGRRIVDDVEELTQAYKRIPA